MCSTPQPRTVYDPIDAAGPAGLSFVAADLTTIEDVSKTLLDQVEASFVSYNEQRGKKFRVTGTAGPTKAIKFLRTAHLERQYVRRTRWHSPIPKPTPRWGDVVRHV